MQGKWKTILTLAVVTLAFGCGETETVRRDRDAGPEVDVQVTEVVAGGVREVREASGTVRSVTTTMLASKVMGYVTAVFADEGEQVRKGQTLITIDDRDIKAQLEQAKAGLDEAKAALTEVESSMLAAESARNAAGANHKLAESTYQRIKELLARKSVSQQEFEEAEARYTGAAAELSRSEEMLATMGTRKPQVEARIAQATARVQNAEILLSYSKIQAPLTGSVVRRMVEMGQLANPGEPLMTVEDTGKYRLEAQVDESQISRVQRGDAVTVRVDALGASLEGTVEEIIPVADPSSRKFTVKVSLPVDGGLRSGMFGRLILKSEERSAMSIPKSAVMVRGQLIGVFIVDSENIARFRLIKKGKDMGDSVEILSGLKAGDRVIIDPANVKDGSPLRIAGSASFQIHEAIESADQTGRYTPWVVRCEA